MPTIAQPFHDLEILVGATGVEVERTAARALLQKHYEGRVETEALKCCPVLTAADAQALTTSVLNSVFQAAQAGALDADAPLAIALIRSVRTHVAALIGRRPLGYLVMLSAPGAQKRWQQGVAAKGEDWNYRRICAASAGLSAPGRLVLRVLLETGLGLAPETIVAAVQQKHGVRLNLLEVAQAIQEIQALIPKALNQSAPL